MSLIKTGTRVVKITYEDDDAHRIGTLGTVMEAKEAGEIVYLVRWDGDDSNVTYAVTAEQIMPQHALKRLFKYGPKLTKKGLVA